MHILEEETDIVQKRVNGRPSKSDIAKNSPKGRGKVGRPKGDAAIINEYKARMLASPKSAAVLKKIFDVALDDDHKNQAACMKMIADRIIPLAAFEKEVVKDSTRNAIQINITGVGTADVREASTIDGDSGEVL